MLCDGSCTYYWTCYGVQLQRCKQDFKSIQRGFMQVLATLHISEMGIMLISLSNKKHIFERGSLLAHFKCQDMWLWPSYRCNFSMFCHIKSQMQHRSPTSLVKRGADIANQGLKKSYMCPRIFFQTNKHICRHLDPPHKINYKSVLA